MADMLADAAEWLADQQTDHLSQTVTYRRGGSGGDTVSLAATPGPIKNGVDPTFGILRVNERDWLIDADLMILGSETVEPRKNDEVVEADGTVWLVLPSDVELEARLLIGGKWRIHTKRIKVDG
jgi:hypothetical protein